MSELIVVRHGETEWSVSGQHTGTTDIPLTARGEQQARHLLDDLGERDFAAVLVSPRQRARRTAELAGIEEIEVVQDLTEWDYGDLEGRTTAEYLAEREAAGLGPWELFTDGAPGGEDAAAVGARVDRVLVRVRAELERGDVLVVGHSHTSRVLVARWLGLSPGHGVGFLIDAAHRGVLTYKRGVPVLQHWNVPPTS
ncbi:histidine phosphatase family protein [Georgenia yuyongxinii]|uniref:Histidine phosphatase family protein n=1 Tax=Georgenia yuyongxinii TaxID=2589797 RepID=A0A552WT27_9MICO|nr:histidine phosphatase family protein [Georgenia yuyongxinii]TRW45990.1 histidine phosphatase family protein [Georgenia yuyongxinii]